MNTGISKLQRRQVACLGVLHHLGNIDEEMKYIGSHINQRTGLKAGQLQLVKCQNLLKTVRKSITAELNRVNHNLKKLAEAEQEEGQSS